VRKNRLRVKHDRIGANPKIRFYYCVAEIYPLEFRVGRLALSRYPSGMLKACFRNALEPKGTPWVFDLRYHPTLRTRCEAFLPAGNRLETAGKRGARRTDSATPFGSRLWALKDHSLQRCDGVVSSVRGFREPSQACERYKTHAVTERLSRGYHTTRRFSVLEWWHMFAHIDTICSRVACTLQPVCG
jgi:hypothetical protein